MSAVTSVLNDANAVFSLLIARTPFGAVWAATLCAIGVTQLVKMVIIHLPNVPNGPRKIWYLTTAFVGVFATMLLWPTSPETPFKMSVVWGLISGTLLAPGTYLAGTRLLYTKFPQLESSISATPKVKP